jgi:hypothetical protein
MAALIIFYSFVFSYGWMSCIGCEFYYFMMYGSPIIDKGRQVKQKGPKRSYPYFIYTFVSLDGFSLNAFMISLLVSKENNKLKIHYCNSTVGNPPMCM